MLYTFVEGYTAAYTAKNRCIALYTDTRCVTALHSYTSCSTTCSNLADSELGLGPLYFTVQYKSVPRNDGYKMAALVLHTDSAETRDGTTGRHRAPGLSK